MQYCTPGVRHLPVIKLQHEPWGILKCKCMCQRSCARVPVYLQMCLKGRQRVYGCYFSCLVPIIKHWLWYCFKCICLPPPQNSSSSTTRKAALSTHKPLQAFEPNLKCGALLRDVYSEVIHHAQYEGGVVLLNALYISTAQSPCCRTCRLAVLSLNGLRVTKHKCPRKYFVNYFLRWHLIPWGRS